MDDDSGAPKGSTRRWRRVFPGEQSQLRELRAWIADLLPDCVARDDLACVATELGTNAVQHTASGQNGWFAVELAWHRAGLRVAVADGGAPAGPQLVDDLAGERGRGLLIVRGLSVRMGVSGDCRGRVVWADIPCGDNGPELSADLCEAGIGADLERLVSSFASMPAGIG
jgi:anti-sigma regulatory factor (Ser/Thr protein kinase)